MSTLIEIKAALPRLSDGHLKESLTNLDHLFHEHKGVSIDNR